MTVGQENHHHIWIASSFSVWPSSFLQLLFLAMRRQVTLVQLVDSECEQLYWECFLLRGASVSCTGYEIPGAAPWGSFSMLCLQKHLGHWSADIGTTRVRPGSVLPCPGECKVESVCAHSQKSRGPEPSAICTEQRHFLAHFHIPTPLSPTVTL